MPKTLSRRSSASLVAILIGLGATATARNAASGLLQWSLVADLLKLSHHDHATLRDHRELSREIKSVYHLFVGKGDGCDIKVSNGFVDSGADQFAQCLLSEVLLCSLEKVEWTDFSISQLTKESSS